MEKEEESKMFLENLTKLEKNLWKSHVEFVGVDHDMAEMYAEDRNDVIDDCGILLSYFRVVRCSSSADAVL